MRILPVIIVFLGLSDGLLSMSKVKWEKTYQMCDVGRDLLSCQRLLDDRLNSSQSCFGLQCYKIGNVYYHLDQFNQAVEFYQKACADGDGEGCNRLGFMYENGDFFQKDMDEALKFYQRACDKNTALGCLNLGLIYFNNKMAVQDFDGNKNNNQKICNLENCDILNKMRSKKELNKQNDKKIFNPSREICNNAVTSDCNNLNKAPPKNKSVKRDLYKAKEFFSKACDLGIQDGCELYEVIK